MVDPLAGATTVVDSPHFRSQRGNRVRGQRPTDPGGWPWVIFTFPLSTQVSGGGSWHVGHGPACSARRRAAWTDRTNAPAPRAGPHRPCPAPARRFPSRPPRSGWRPAAEARRRPRQSWWRTGRRAGTVPRLARDGRRPPRRRNLAGRPAGVLRRRRSDPADPAALPVDDRPVTRAFPDPWRRWTRHPPDRPIGARPPARPAAEPLHRAGQRR